MTIVEKVARALALSAGGQMIGPGRNVAASEIGWLGDGEHFDQYVERHWREHENAARLAIEVIDPALLEPKP